MFAVEQAASDARGKLRHSRVYPIKIARTTINFAQVALFCVFSTAIGDCRESFRVLRTSHVKPFFEQVQRDTFHLILTFFRHLSVHTKLLKYFLSLLTMQTYGPVTYHIRGAQGVGNADTRFVSLPHASQAEIRGNNAKTARKRTLHAHRVHHPGNFR